MRNPEFDAPSPVARAIARSGVLDPLADAIQPTFRAARDADPRAKSLLSGTWLGHALHPVLTDVPIGAFTALAALDVAELAGAKDVARATDITLGVAIVSAYAAIVTGWADWSDTAGAPRRVGLAHALVNGTGMLAYQAGLGLKLAGRRNAGIAASFLGYAFIAAGAFLGGELTSAMHLGVRHLAAPLPPPDQFVDVASVEGLGEDGWVAVDATGVPVLLARDAAGTIHAVGAICTHRGAPLREGIREGDCVRCPWHGARFSLLDGAVEEGPATFGLPRYDVRVDGGRIAIRAVS